MLQKKLCIILVKKQIIFILLCRDNYNKEFWFQLIWKINGQLNLKIQLLYHKKEAKLVSSGKRELFRNRLNIL